jgi:hypothetical protein
MPAGRRHRPLRVVAVRAPVPRNGSGLRGPRSQGPARSSLQPRADPPTTLTAPPARARTRAPGLRYRSFPRSGPRRRPAPASGSAATLRLMSAGRQDEARSAGQPRDEPGGGGEAGQVHGHAGHQRSDGESGSVSEQRPWHGRLAVASPQPPRERAPNLGANDSYVRHVGGRAYHPFGTAPTELAVTECHPFLGRLRAERRLFALVGRTDREVVCAQILRLWALPSGSRGSAPRPANSSPHPNGWRITLRGVGGVDVFPATMRHRFATGQGVRPACPDGAGTERRRYCRTPATASTPVPIPCPADSKPSAARCASWSTPPTRRSPRPSSAPTAPASSWRAAFLYDGGIVPGPEGIITGAMPARPAAPWPSDTAKQSPHTR